MINGLENPWTTEETVVYQEWGAASWLDSRWNCLVAARRCFDSVIWTSVRVKSCSLAPLILLGEISSIFLIPSRTEDFHGFIFDLSPFGTDSKSKPKRSRSRSQSQSQSRNRSRNWNRNQRRNHRVAREEAASSSAIEIPRTPSGEIKQVSARDKPQGNLYWNILRICAACSEW